MAEKGSLESHPIDLLTESLRGKTILSDADLAQIEADLASIRANFTDIPLLIGEFDASPLNCEPAARRKWHDLVTRTAAELDTAVVIWDNGLDHLDRNTGTWRDPVSLAIVDAVIRGERNSLPDSTTDPSATTQFSSAFVWNRAGEEVSDYELPWLFNGNTLVSIEYIPAMGDWKTAWDHIHFKGFLGCAMTLQFTWQGCDSLLAAPLAIDLARLVDLARQRGAKGLQTHLAPFFKNPEGVAENDFFRQTFELEAYAARLRQG